MAKQQEKIDCRLCQYSDKKKVGDHMIWCVKLGYYRSFGLRYCNIRDNGNTKSR